VSKEQGAINHLTNEPKNNLSLLYYDFNNANQRIQAKLKQNFTDLIIPEEIEELVKENRSRQSNHKLDELKSQSTKNEMDIVNSKINKAKERIN